MKIQLYCYEKKNIGSDTYSVVVVYFRRRSQVYEYTDNNDNIAIQMQVTTDRDALTIVGTKDFEFEENVKKSHFVP